MKFIEIECPGCKADLEIDQDNMIAFCPYCGKKLFYEFDGMSYVLTEKEKTKRTILKNNTKLKTIELEKEENRKDDIHKLKINFLYFLFFIFVMLTWYFLACYVLK